MSLNKSNSEKTIESFSAKILDGNNDKHSDLIKEAVDDKNIFNVALSGAYGSGKTSIIKTFKHKHSSLEYIDISLATFDEKLIDEKSLLKLEYCILKQLFYKVSPEKVPQSRFKRIVNHKNTSVNAIFFFLWLLSIFYFLKNKLLISLIQALGLSYYCAPLNAIFSAYAILGLGFIVYKLYDFIINFKMTKLKFSEAEVENKDDKATLNFENEIDEILYFFERNPTHVVFIEDLDRFKNTEIFIKLREINFLINNYEPIKEKGKVTFIYAVLDNIFSQNERTKFFDLILPVVPIVNYTNSAKELLDRFKDEINLIKDEEKRNDFIKFIEKVSLYLTDMRVIISICNEYKVYKKILNEKIDEKKLLAMMIYKNTEPTDFDLLNQKKGYVYSLFSYKKKYIEEKITEYNKEIEKITPKITECEKEYITSENELRLLYVAKFFELLKKNIMHLKINDVNFKVNEIISNENFNNFKINNNISYYNGYSTETSKISFKDIENSINPKLNYDQRLANVKNKIHENIENLKKQIADFENKIKLINSKSLHDLLLNEINSEIYFSTCENELKSRIIKDINTHNNETSDEDNLKKLEQKKENLTYRLVNFLIETGNIDEDYEHYISRQDGNLTTDDRNFLLNFNSTSLPFDTKLNGFETIINRLDESYYYKRGILNFSLINHMLDFNKNIYLNKIFSKLSDDSEYYMKFVDEYLEQLENDNKNKFITQITETWSDIFDYIQNKSNFTFEKKSIYVNLFFSYLTIDKIYKLDTNKSIFYFLSYSKTLSPIYFEDENKSKVELYINEKTICFENLEYEEKHHDLLQFIYDNNHYELNEKMIELMISTFKKNDIEIVVDDLKKMNYTIIQNSGCEKLIDYIGKNNKIYVENVFLEIEENTEEDEKSIISLLQINDENLELQKKIINKQNNKISNLSKVKSDIWDELFDKNKIKATWENILIYYYEFKSLNGLETFLNIEDNYKYLSESFIIDGDSDKTQDEFIIELINLEITDDSFGYLVNSIEKKYDDISTLKLKNLDRLKPLIDNKKINPTNENIDFIYENDRNEYINLIELHEQLFQETFNLFELNDEVIYNLIVESNLSAASISLITNKNNDDICNLSNEKLSQITNKFIQISFSDFSSELYLLLLNSISENKIKIKLLKLKYDNLNEREVLETLELIGSPYDKVKYKEKFFVENTPENIDLLNLLTGRFIKKPYHRKDNYFSVVCI